MSEPETVDQRKAREAKEQAEREAQEKAAREKEQRDLKAETQSAAQRVGGGRWTVFDDISRGFRSNDNSNAVSWWKVGLVAALGGAGALAGMQMGWIGAIGLGLAGAAAGFFGADPILTFLGLEKPKEQVKTPAPAERGHVRDPNEKAVKKEDIVLPAVTVMKDGKPVTVAEKPVSVSTGVYVKDENPTPDPLNGKPLRESRAWVEAKLKLAGKEDGGKNKDNAESRKFVQEVDTALLYHEVTARWSAAQIGDLKKNNDKIRSYLSGIGVPEERVKALLPMPENVDTAIADFHKLADMQGNTYKELEKYGVETVQRMLPDILKVPADQVTRERAEQEWNKLNTVQKRSLILNTAEAMKYQAVKEGGEYEYRRYFSYFTDSLASPSTPREDATWIERKWQEGREALSGLHFTYFDRIRERNGDEWFPKLRDAHNKAMALEAQGKKDEARVQWAEVLTALRHQRDHDGGLSESRKAALNKHIGWLGAKVSLEEMENHLKEALPKQMDALEEFERQAANGPKKLEALKQAVEQHKATGIFLLSESPGKVQLRDTRLGKTFDIEVKTKDGKQVYTVSDGGKTQDVPLATGGNSLEPAQLRRVVDEAVNRPARIEVAGNWIGSMLDVKTPEPGVPLTPAGAPATPARTPAP